MSGFVNRLVVGGAIDRNRPLQFWFNGKAYRGYAGDTLASALIANDVFEIGRSSRHGRPRGIVGAGREEPNAYVLIEGSSSGERFATATTLELWDGLRARTANRNVPPRIWPDKPGRKRVGSVPYRVEGDGSAPQAFGERPAETRHDFCDVLIIGGGPAGLAAARTAVAAGASVILVERERTLGGALRWEDLAIDAQPPQRWIAAAIREIEGRANATLLRNATAVAGFEHNLVHVIERLEEPGPAGLSVRRVGLRLRKVRAKHIVLATGAIEQTIVLPDNDRPGVMLASAARYYLRRFAVLPGRQAVIVTNNDSAYRTALDFAQIGIKVMAVVDIRESPQTDLSMAVRQAGVEVIPASIVAALKGRSHVDSAVVAAIDERGRPRLNGAHEFGCDLVCLSGGWQPNLDLFAESGGEITYDRAACAFLPGRHPDAMTVVGAAAGFVLNRDCIQSGYEAGRDVAASLKRGIAAMPARPVTDEQAPMPTRPFERPPAGAPKTEADAWIDPAADVTLAEMDVAAKDGFRTLDQIAARTGLFRGPDNGLASAVNTRTILGNALGLTPDGLGERPVWPVRDAPLRAFAPADSRRRFRALPNLQAHLDTDVIFRRYGGWLYPACYAGPGEAVADAVRREAMAARHGVTLFDRSAEGKIEICGRDAAAFLDRLVTADVTALTPGEVVRTDVLDDAGMIIDRCRIARFGESCLVLTSLGQGGAIERWFRQWRQLGWAELSVFITDVSAQWSVLTVGGPRAEALWAKMGGDGIAAGDACIETNFAGHRCRLFADSRLDVPEIEIHVAANVGAALWTRLVAAGLEFDLCPIGLEARNILEMENGGLPLQTAYGARWSPIDFGPVDAIEAKTRDFIGRRMALRATASETARPQLVGIVPGHEELVARPGALLVARRGADHPIGTVIAGQFSPRIGRAFALGFLDDGRKRLGDAIGVFLDGKAHPARVTAADPISEEGAAHG